MPHQNILVRLSAGSLAAFLLTPFFTNAQIPSGCHLITADERAALALREAAIPTSGIFCDNDRVLLFGSCPTDPLPFLLTRKALGPTCSRDGNRAITRLNSEFACRLSKYLTAYPSITITCGWRSYDTQNILWQEALAKYGSPDAARKYVAPPGNSRHESGEAADLAGVPEPARPAATGFGLYYCLGYEPWHIEPTNLQVSPPPSYDMYTDPSGSYGGTFYPPYGAGTGTNYSSIISNIVSIVGILNYFYGGTGTGSGTGFALPSLSAGGTITGTTTPFLLSLSPTSTPSLADYLLGMLQDPGSGLYFANPILLSQLTSTSSLTTASTSPAGENDELRRSLMIQIVALLSKLLELLRAQIGITS